MNNLLFTSTKNNEISNIRQELFNNGKNKISIEFTFVDKDFQVKLKTDESYKKIGKEMIRIIKDMYDIKDDYID